MAELRKYVEVSKVDEALGIVIGWGLISTQKGEPYVDLQSDTIPPDVMVKAAADFMANSRVALEMHDPNAGQKGSVVFAMPVTKEIAESLGMLTDTEGLAIGVRFEDPAVLAKFASGELTGFSIGGFVDEFEEYEIDG